MPAADAPAIGEADRVLILSHREAPIAVDRPKLMSLDEEEIYQERILDHYEQPFHRGHCPRATHAHEDDNPLCGDVVRMELRVSPAGKIEDVYFDGQGCCISQAAASLLTERLQGADCAQAQQMSAQEMLDLLGVKLTPNRQKCGLLCWRVMQAALFSPVAKPGEAPCGNAPRG